MDSIRLTSNQREFFAKVSKAVFANPFGRNRADLDLELSGCTVDTPDQELFQALLGNISTHLVSLFKDSTIYLDRIGAADRDLIRSAMLFDMFHRCTDDFDDHIRKQERSDTPLSIPFSRDIIAKFIGRGFQEAEALHCFALFFQVRRAFYFIRQGIAGDSSCMRTLRMQLWNNVFTHQLDMYVTLLWNRMEDFSTLLLGETGTGKGAAAGSIGRSGYIPFDPKKQTFVESFTAAFIAINLSEFSPTLIESELFGHQRGAFTGATEAHDGILSRCSQYGSIFLDEIGEISAALQVKLLRILQERVFSPVGSHRQLPFRGRIIAATNAAVPRPNSTKPQSNLRPDFYFRLSSDVILMPSLRQRLTENPDEFKLLLDHILKLIGAGEMSDQVLASLTKSVSPDYSWPGNVRELEQAARRILLTGQYQPTVTAAAAADSTMTADQVLSAYCQRLYEQHGNYGAVSRITGLDRRTVKKYIAHHIVG